MKRITALLCAFAILLCLPAAAEEATVPGIWAAMESTTATPAPDAFRFRDGIRWGMNPQQVKALEGEAMTERSMGDWSIMVTAEKVAVSRFTADLVFMFLKERLMMITYEFQREDAASDFQYLTGALRSVYGEAAPADPATVKNLMDAIYPNRYRTDKILQPCCWGTADGTSIYLYFYSGDAFAVMYVSPELGSGIYQTNGL